MSTLKTARAARCSAALLLCIASAMTFVGCVGPAPSADINRTFKSATGLSDDIVFHEDGGPLDVESPAGVLSVDEAVRRSLRTDPQIQAALARVRIALADAHQVRLLPNPIIAVAFRFPEGGGKPVIEASLTAEVLSILQRPRRASAADHRLRAATAEAMVTVLDAIAAVQVTYANLQSLDAKAGVLEERRKLVGRLFDLANARMKAGESSRLDVLVLNNERVEVETESLEAVEEATQERLKLDRLVGSPSGGANWEISPWEKLPAVSADQSAWIDAALKHRPEIQARLWELAALGDDAALASWAAFDGPDAGVDSERDRKWTVGPSIASPLPLFDWGQAKRARVSAEQSESRHKLTRTRRQVVEDVRRAIASLSMSKRLLEKVQSELLPIAQQRHSQAEAAYKAGAADITTLIQAEQGLLDARMKLLESQRKHSSALSQLHRAAGGSAVVRPNIQTQPSSTSPANHPEVEETAK